jgi:hypothetical protein
MGNLIGDGERRRFMGAIMRAVTLKRDVRIGNVADPTDEDPADKP